MEQKAPIEEKLPIKKIVKVQSELETFFGFSLDKLNFEFLETYTRLWGFIKFKIKEEKRKKKKRDLQGIMDIFKEIKQETNSSINFMLELDALSNWNIAISIIVTDKFKPKIDQLCEKYLIENEDFAFSLLLMATLVNRKDISKGETEHLESHLYEYNYRVRPDMLQLYIAINKPTGEYSDDSFTIKRGNNKPQKIEDASGWFSNALHKYLKKYLGVESVEEAERELYEIYGGKVGPQIKPAFNAYMWGTYHLLQKTDLKSKTEKSVTNKQCRFIEEYLRIIGLINPMETIVDQNNIRGRLNAYLKKDYPISIKDIIDERNYKVSPNNKNGLSSYNLWLTSELDFI